MSDSFYERLLNAARKQMGWTEDGPTREYVREGIQDTLSPESQADRAAATARAVEHAKDFYPPLAIPDALVAGAEDYYSGRAEGPASEHMLESARSGVTDAYSRIGDPEYARRMRELREDMERSRALDGQEEIIELDE